MTTHDQAKLEIRLAKAIAEIKRLRAERAELAAKLMEFTRYSANSRQAFAQRIEAHQSIFGGSYAAKCDND